MLTKREFKKHYFQVLNDIRKNIDIDMVTKKYLVKNNYDFHNFDMNQYLDNSFIRVYNIYKMLPETPCSIADVGGFFGNFSLCFARLGYRVTLFESYEYYDNCFEGLVEYFKINNIEIRNVNFTKELGGDGYKGQFDCSLCLAFLEHLCESPKITIDNLKFVTKDNGYIFLEVPNIANIANRLQLLSGKTILPSIESIYRSNTPFMGHFHEYTGIELELLARLSGLDVLKKLYCNYSYRNSLFRKLVFLPSYLIPSLREIVLIKTQKKDNE